MDMDNDYCVRQSQRTIFARMWLRVCITVFVAGMLLLAHTTASGAAGLSQPFAVDTRVSRPDFDQDGLPDVYEQRSGLNWQVADAGDDPDGDGLTNLQEYNAGTNPTVSDRFGRHVLVSGLWTIDTGGALRDTDGDGMPNWWERMFFTNATSALRSADSDGDRHNNFAEFLAGTNPTDQDSVLTIIEVRPGAFSVVRWSSVAARNYSLWRLSGNSAAFELVASNLVATPPINSHTNEPSSAREFYRVGTAP
jgi:hypothetical protein